MKACFRRSEAICGRLGIATLTANKVAQATAAKRSLGLTDQTLGE